MKLVKKQTILLIVLIIFYTVGVVGMNTSYRSDILALTPFNLLLSLACLYLSFKDYSFKKHVDLLLVAVAGYTVEWIGVHTALLFGEYHYGDILGPKLDDISLIIGVNWLLLTFSASAIVHKWQIPLALKALIAGALMTALDWLIEPVAIRLGFWSWHQSGIPVYNYVCWMIFSTLFCFWILKRKTVETNQVSTGLFVIMLIFFAILNR